MSFDPTNPPMYSKTTLVYHAPAPTPTNGSKPEVKPEVKEEPKAPPTPPPTPIISLPDLSKQSEEFAKRVIQDVRQDVRTSGRKPSVSTRIRQAHRVMKASAPVVASSTRLFLDITKAVGAFAQEVENAEHGKYPQQGQNQQKQNNNNQQKNPQKNQKDKHGQKKAKRTFLDRLLDELIAWTTGALKALIGLIGVGLLALCTFIAPPFSGILLLAFLLPTACALFILHVYQSK